jgi:hypothetical protein
VTGPARPRAAHARDVDRQKVYDAEERAFGGTSMEERLDWSDVVVLVAAVVSDPWWHALGVPSPQLVRARADADTSSADGAQLRIAAPGHNAVTVAHELAHHLVAHVLGRRADGRQLAGGLPAAHGAEFRAAALRTASVVGGGLARVQLCRAWRDAGLSVATWSLPEPTPREPRALRGSIPL